MTGWLWSFPAGLMLMGVVLAVLMAVWVQTRPDFAGRGAFLGMWLSLCWWCLFAVLEITILGTENKAMLARWTWPAIIAMPSFWAVFSLRYLYGWQRKIKIKSDGVYLLPAILLVVLALTDPWHHGLYRSYYPSSDMVNAGLIYKPGWVYYTAAFYLYLLMLSAFSLNILSLERGARVYRRHYQAFLLASLLPWVANLGYITSYWTLFDFDPTPFCLLITCHIFAYLMWRSHLFDLVPVARNLLIDSFPDPVLLLDGQDRVIDANHSALQLLYCFHELEVIGASIDCWPELAGWLKSGKDQTLEVQGKYYELSLTRIPGAVQARVFVLHNVTQRILVGLELRQALQVLEDQLEKNQQLQLKLREEAIRDPLTGAYNRRFLEEVAGHELAHAVRVRQPLALVMIDFDYFKQINDGYGHAAGDAALLAFVRLWSGRQRADDYCIRYGGEEWLLLLPGCNAGQAYQFVDQFRQSFAAYPVSAEGLSFKLTFSAGIACCPDYAAELDILLAEADKALYRAKNAGRNRVFIASDQIVCKVPSDS